MVNSASTVPLDVSAATSMAHELKLDNIALLIRKHNATKIGCQNFRLGFEFHVRVDIHMIGFIATVKLASLIVILALSVSAIVVAAKIAGPCRVGKSCRHQRHCSTRKNSVHTHKILSRLANVVQNQSNKKTITPRFVAWRMNESPEEAKKNARQFMPSFSGMCIETNKPLKRDVAHSVVSCFFLSDMHIKTNWGTQEQFVSKIGHAAQEFCA